MKRRFAVPFLAMTCLSCSMLSGLWRPARAPASEASKVVFSMYTPDTAMKLDGVRLRAVDLAMRDFMSEAAGSCFDQADSYDVVVWTAEPGATPDGGEPSEDGGVNVETMFGTPGLVYVEITLRPGACDDGGEVVLDEGATYAIDVKSWRIAASRR